MSVKIRLDNLDHNLDHLKSKLGLRCHKGIITRIFIFPEVQICYLHRSYKGNTAWMIWGQNWLFVSLKH